MKALDLALIRNEMEKKDGKRIFLLYGQESFLYQEMILAARLALLNKDLADFNETLLDGRQTSLGEVLSAARTPPVLDPYRLTIVSDAPYFKKDRREGTAKKNKGRDEQVLLLEEFIRDRISFSCLIFTCDEVDQRLSLYKLIARQGIALESKPLKGKELVVWIDQRIRRLNKNITRDAVQILVDLVGNDLRLLRQELMKAAAYAGEKKSIERQDILAIASRTLENNIFALIDQVGRKNRGQALRLLADMLLMNEPPVRILFMLIRQMRLVADCQLLLLEGVNRNELASFLDSHPFAVQKALEHLPAFSPNDLQWILRELLQADEDLKSGQGEPRLILEKMLIKMSA